MNLIELLGTGKDALTTSIRYLDIVFIINALLLTPGLFTLFPKCGTGRGWAFVPFYRLYRLAQCADREDAGMIYAIASIVITAVMNVMAFGFAAAYDEILVGVLIAAFAVYIVYGIRIYSAVCRLFEKSLLWLLLWAAFSCIPAIIWGFSKAVGPTYRDPAARKAARVSGAHVATAENGLTVNLEYRAVRNFLKRKYLLKDIHLNIRPGTMVLLLGGSGSGKTTFINAVTGYEKAKATVTLNGEDVYRHYDKMLYEIGVVPQKDLIRNDDTVVRTLSDAAALRLSERVTPAQRRQRVNEVLDIFGLTSVKNSEVEKLSGGQKKRVSIAMEFIADPALFILDEPDSGLDGVLARDLMRRLHDISRTGKTVMVITHTPDRVIDMFDSVIVLAKDANNVGRLVYGGSVDGARSFFGAESMEEIVRIVSRPGEGGDGRADELIERFMEMQHAGI